MEGGAGQAALEAQKAMAAAPGSAMEAQAPATAAAGGAATAATAAAVPAQPPAPLRSTQAARQAPPLPPVAAATTKRGGRRGGRRAAVAVPEPEELVKLGPEVSKDSERLRTGWRHVTLSAEDKAAEVALSDCQLIASSDGGYRMARATHGAFTGTWYFQVKVVHLGPSGAARVGWSTRQAELNGPVGADERGFSYRSMHGSKVHGGRREAYGEPFGEGDVVGCLLHMGEGGRPFEKGPTDVVKYKSKLYFLDGPQPEPQELAGSFVAFTLNGRLQGKAYTNLKEGTYFPAVSLYTNRVQQREPATVALNFGQQGFAFPLPLVEGCPPPRPTHELSGLHSAPAAAPAVVVARQQQEQRQPAGDVGQQQAPPPAQQPLPREQQQQAPPSASQHLSDQAGLPPNEQQQESQQPQQAQGAAATEAQTGREASHGGAADAGAGIVGGGSSGDAGTNPAAAAGAGGGQGSTQQEESEQNEDMDVDIC